mmetsp:Transcript_58136/g.96258  ORF Transcript_58136/g.96258 Transcript_58136/m.96258 type:complete len:134 (+) Transcript_58136:208-609(+)
MALVDTTKAAIATAPSTTCRCKPLLMSTQSEGTAEQPSSHSDLAARKNPRTIHQSVRRQQVDMDWCGIEYVQWRHLPQANMCCTLPRTQPMKNVKQKDLGHCAAGFQGHSKALKDQFALAACHHTYHQPALGD